MRDHLVADVPVGVFLSSGLDSTILAGLAAKHTQRLRSFTVGFADQPDLSEQALATETAKLFGLEHTNIDLSGNDADNPGVGEILTTCAFPSVHYTQTYDAEVVSDVFRASLVKDFCFGGSDNVAFNVWI